MPMPSPALRRATLVGCCALALAYAVVANVELDRRLADPAAAARLTGRDSRTYLSIAERLARGRFAMRYVKNYPHRQPLYPAALAVVLALRGPDLRALANVNVLAVTLSIVLVGAASLRAFESVPAALTGALLVATNPLLFEESVARLLTEPVFVAWVAAALYALARFFESGRPSLLCTASALLGLAYLTRPNGLFLFAAAWTVTALHTLRRWQKAPAPRPALRGAAAPLALALLVFVAVTLPSWLPRAAHTGNPLNHGYLSDFLWVDRYDEAKGHGLPLYSARDYFAVHDAGDALQRLAYGAGRVLWAVPTREFGTAATLVMLAGMLLFVARRRTSWLLVLAVGALQLLPVAWAQLSNPNRRVAAAALLPFGLYAGAFLGSCLARLVSRAAPRRGLLGLSALLLLVACAAPFEGEVTCPSRSTDSRSSCPARSISALRYAARNAPIRIGRVPREPGRAARWPAAGSGLDSRSAPAPEEPVSAADPHRLQTLALLAFGAMFAKKYGADAELAAKIDASIEENYRTEL